MASSTRKEFDAAFRSAVDAGQSTFEFNGKKYNTKMAPAKTTSNRGGARLKSSPDVMDTIARVGKVERGPLEDMNIMPTSKPRSSGFSIGMGAEPIEDVRAREENMRSSLKSMAESDLTPKAGSRPTDDSGTMGYRKGGMVKAKRTSNRGCGIAVKGFGKAGSR